MPRVSARTARRLAARPTPKPRSEHVSDDDLRRVDALVPEWLTVPEVAERLDMTLLRARQLLGDREVLAVRRGPNAALYVPAAFLGPDGVIRGLPGTIRVLTDAGFSDVDAVCWLFTPDDSLPGTPVEALAGDRGTEVKRRAQALAL